MRVGLGYVKGVREEEMESLVADRERSGHYPGIADLASRSGAGRDGLERLAWAGAWTISSGRRASRRRHLDAYQAVGGLPGGARRSGRRGRRDRGCGAGRTCSWRCRWSRRGRPRWSRWATGRR